MSCGGDKGVLERRTSRFRLNMPPFVGMGGVLIPRKEVCRRADRFGRGGGVDTGGVGVVSEVVRSRIDAGGCRSKPGRSSEGVTTVEGDWGFVRLRLSGRVRERVREDRVGIVSRSTPGRERESGEWSRSRLNRELGNQTPWRSAVKARVK